MGPGIQRGSKGKGNFCAIPACPGWVQGVDLSEDPRFVSFQASLTCQHHTALGRTGVYGRVTNNQGKRRGALSADTDVVKIASWSRGSNRKHVRREIT